MGSSRTSTVTPTGWGTPAWEYAYYAFVIYLRAAADLTGRTTAYVATDLGARGSGATSTGDVPGDSSR